jgi:HlyD family secretion protein
VGWSGYVEGEYVYVSSALGGTLTSLAVGAGEQVALGAPLFSLDPDAEQAARQQADAQLARAQAAANNLSKGRRAEEIAVLQAQLTQAQAQARQAASDLAREQQLVAQGFVSPARSEALRTALAAAQARVEELQAQLQVARLPARSDERAAAQADTAAATQQVRQLAWREAQKTRTAPVAALVADSFFRVGEWVAPGQPVVSLLPPANIKVKFFVAQEGLPGIQLGTAVQVRCDGCAAPIAAKVSFMASRAEYTPPVIYSNAQRAKLVFLIEARPNAGDAEKLRPGQPVDVALAAGKAP